LGADPNHPVIPADLDEITDQDTDTPITGINTDAVEAAGTRARRVAQAQHRQTLAAVHHAQREAHLQIRRAEAKATALLAVFAAALAAALILTRTVHSGLAGWLAAAAVVPLLGAVAALVSVLHTRQAGHVPGIRRWALFREHPDVLAADLDLPVRRQIRAQAARLAELAATAVSCARRINAALALMLAGLVLLAGAVLTG